jgi:hypothetical protein
MIIIKSCISIQDFFVTIELFSCTMLPVVLPYENGYIFLIAFFICADATSRRRLRSCYRNIFNQELFI